MIAALIVGCLTAPVAAGSGTSTTPPGSLEQLLDRFDVARLPADFVVAIDTSGSMSEGAQPPYPAVRDAYAQFVKAPTATDHLSLISFDTVPNLRFESTLDSERQRTSALQLPNDATGQHTDIGAAIDGVLMQLERPNASAVQIVMFLTDGEHDPGPGSPYPSTSGAAWAALRDRAQRDAVGHELVVFGEGLPTGGSTDIGLLRTVFPRTQIVSLPPSQLPSFFQDAVLRARIERLRRPVQTEFDSGSVTSSLEVAGKLGRTTTLIVHPTSAYEHLPVRVDVSGITVTDATSGSPLPADIVSGPRSFVIAPDGQGPPLRIAVSTEFTPRGSVGSHTQAESFQVALHATETVLPDQLLQQLLGTQTAGKLQQPAGSVTARVTSGLSWTRLWTYVGLVVLLLLILLLLYRRFVWLPTLTGGLQTAEEGFIPLHGKRTDVPDAKRPLVKTDGAVAHFFTKRGKPGRVFVEEKQSRVEIGLPGLTPEKLNGQRLVKFPARIIIGRLDATYSRTGKR